MDENEIPSVVLMTWMMNLIGQAPSDSLLAYPPMDSQIIVKVYNLGEYYLASCTFCQCILWDLRFPVCNSLLPFFGGEGA